MTVASDREHVDVIVVGGGQSGLAVGYYLARAQGEVDRGRAARAPSFVILDDRDEPGGAWIDGWDSLRLFSPAASSSLPGRQMPPWGGPGTPSAEHVVSYLTGYEQRYGLPVSRPEKVHSVIQKKGGFFTVASSRGIRTSSSVVMATGTWGKPYVPAVPGMTGFVGRQLHTSDYRGSESFAGMRVLVVGGGNSGAQIAADVSAVADVTWVTRRTPRYLPDDVDGRALFELATAQIEHGGRGLAELGDIVVVPPVKAARDQGRLQPREMFTQMTPNGVIWSNGASEYIDAIIWCTGFRPDLPDLTGLHLTCRHGVPATRTDLPVASADVPGLYFVGYGDWCGTASATLIGVGSPARSTVRELTS